jgi:hypothetical protein
MVNTNKSSLFRLGLSAALLALLLVGNMQPYTIALNNADLERVRGTGFWSDPCTLDGFAVGAGAVLCGAGSWGGCIGAITGFIRAWKVDDCF